MSYAGNPIGTPSDVLVLPDGNIAARAAAVLSASQTPDPKFPLSRLADDRPSQRFIFPTLDVDDFVLVQNYGLLNANFNTWVGGLPSNFTVTETGTGSVTEETNPVNVVDGSSLEMANGSAGNCEVEADLVVNSGDLVFLDVYTSTTSGASPNEIEIYNPVTGNYLQASGDWEKTRANAFEYTGTSFGHRTGDSFVVEGFEENGDRHEITLKVRLHQDNAAASQTHRYDNLFFLPAVNLVSVHSHNIDPSVVPILARSYYSLDGVPVDHALLLDGSTQWLRRASEMDGLIDSDKFVLSAFVRLDGRDASRRTILINDTERLIIDFDAANELRVVAYDSSPTILINRVTTTTFTASSTYLHVLIAVDLSVPTIQVYVNDSVEATSGALNTGTIDFTGDGWTVGANSAGTYEIEGVLGPIFFYPGLYLDLSVEANRRLFVTADGGWVNLGANGRTPFGSTPHLYLIGNGATEFASNVGGGGAFTAAGSPEALIISDEMTFSPIAFYKELSASEGSPFWRVKFQGENSTETGSISVGQVYLGEAIALLRNPNQQDFERVESLTQTTLETADVRERWTVKKETLKRRAYRMRFVQTDEHQARWETEIWGRTEFGGKALVFVPDNQEAVVIHSRPVRNEFTIRKRTSDVQAVDLDLFESPHGIVTE